MNESAQIQSVKSLSLSDDEVQHHLRALRRHQKGMRYHIKCLLGMTSTTATRRMILRFLEGNDSEAAPPRTREQSVPGRVAKVGRAGRWTG